MAKKKLKRKRPMPVRTDRYVYADDSGNSGLNLFDDGQPFYWTGALISPADLQVASLESHKRWTAHLGVTELHGAALGLKGIEQIATGLRDFVRSQRCSFVFSTVEKVYHAGTMLAQLVLDSDYNRAVAPHHDNIPYFRRLLTVAILSVLHYGDARRFWHAYLRHDEEGFVQVLDNLRVRIHQIKGDQRTKELLLDALGWACRHPGEILRRLNRAWALPNIHGLAGLLRGIRESLTGASTKIIKFHHDEQKEFKQMLTTEFEWAKNVAETQDGALGIPRYIRVETFDCPIEFHPSQLSIGVQLIDAVLWLKQREQVDTGTPLPPGCRELLAYVEQSAVTYTFTHDWLKQKMLNDHRALMAREISPEQEAGARERMARMEASRKRRMTSTRPTET